MKKLRITSSSTVMQPGAQIAPSLRGASGTVSEMITFGLGLTMAGPRVLVRTPTPKLAICPPPEAAGELMLPGLTCVGVGTTQSEYMGAGPLTLPGLETGPGYGTTYQDCLNCYPDIQLTLFGIGNSTCTQCAAYNITYTNPFILGNASCTDTLNDGPLGWDDPGNPLVGKCCRATFGTPQPFGLCFDGADRFTVHWRPNLDGLTWDFQLNFLGPHAVSQRVVWEKLGVTVNCNALDISFIAADIIHNTPGSNPCSFNFAIARIESV